MKRTKVMTAVVLAVVMIVSVASMGFAVSADIGQGAQAGTADSTVTMAISATAPKSISATVPLTIPLAVKVDAGSADATPVAYAPTDCKIINNSKDLAQPAGSQDIAIKISKITATVAPGSTKWNLKEDIADTVTPGAAYDLQLELCGSAFTDLKATSGGIAEVPTIADSYNNIPGGSSAILSVAAAVGGKNSEYTDFNDGVAADIFKVQFEIAEAPATP